MFKYDTHILWMRTSSFPDRDVRRGRRIVGLENEWHSLNARGQRLGWGCRATPVWRKCPASLTIIATHTGAGSIHRNSAESIWIRLLVPDRRHYISVAQFIRTPSIFLFHIALVHWSYIVFQLRLLQYNTVLFTCTNCANNIHAASNCCCYCFCCCFCWLVINV